MSHQSNTVFPKPLHPVENYELVVSTPLGFQPRKPPYFCVNATL
jgi:hypothetical protein